MAFNVTFAVPGGFVADDHKDPGTPTLARRYPFHAFMMANALAFICSLIATIGLTLSGSPLYNLKTRRFNLATSIFFLSSSVTCLSAAFALGVYMVLAPVGLLTAIAICVLSPLPVLYRSLEIITKLFILARPVFHRMGPIHAAMWFMKVIVSKMIIELWPFLIMYVWAAVL